ncbi:hypothetical protein [Rhodococcus sp. OK302]|uniref:hypothetical protein n=1 Tax=Rhodococcus sp. OK302 TaxID=1882769 RepID=UPI0011401AA0|nr:hypothetical protein [Rhodococcus sp. OK302]
MKYPRRGGFPSSIPESDPSADLRVDEYVLAARRHRQGDTSPLGAAALFRLLTRQWYGPDSETSNFADHWVSEFGLADAYVMYSKDGPPPEAIAPLGYASARMYVATRLRALLVDAEAGEYEAARAVAQRLRTTAVRAMIATFLFPTERAWADEVFLSGAEPSWQWRILTLA